MVDFHKKVFLNSRGQIHVLYALRGEARMWHFVLKTLSGSLWAALFDLFSEFSLLRPTHTTAPKDRKEQGANSHRTADAGKAQGKK